MGKKIFILITMLFFGTNVNALTYGGCEYSSVANMKSLVNNVNIYYDYHIVDSKVYFDVTLTNITPDLYFIDTFNEKKYTYNDTNNGEITIYNYSIKSGSYKFYSNFNKCIGLSVGTKYYKFPSYNSHYKSKLCEDIPTFSLCQKWVKINYSDHEFEEKVLEYKNSLLKDDDVEEDLANYEVTIFDKIIGIYISFYYYFLGAIILICTVIMIIKRKNNSFKL